MIGKFLSDFLYALLFLASSIILSFPLIKLVEVLPDRNPRKLRREGEYLFFYRTFPLITKRFFEKFNVFCEQLSSNNCNYYNSQKKIYIIILKKFNNHGQTIAIYSSRKFLISEEKLRNFIQTFALRLEKRASNQNGTLMIFTRTKKSPYFDWYWSDSKTRLQKEAFYDLIEDT